MKSKDSNSKKSVSYQKKDGCGHRRSSFFWHDNDKDLKACFLVTRITSQCVEKMCLAVFDLLAILGKWFIPETLKGLFSCDACHIFSAHCDMFSISIGKTLPLHVTWGWIGKR